MGVKLRWVRRIPWFDLYVLAAAWTNGLFFGWLLFK